MKEAIALGDAGYRVTLLGVSASGRLAIDTIDGGVVMIRLPGRFVLRDERHRRHRLRRTRRLVTIQPAPAQAARVAARLADLKAESGRALANRRAKAVGPLTYLTGTVLRSLTYRRWWLSQVASSLRTWLAEYEARRVAEFWQWWDGWLPGGAARPHHEGGVRRTRVRPGLSQYGGRTPRIIAAWAQHEREYIRTADRVVTVSPAIARTLRRRYRLDREPTVVINSPQLIAEGNEITDVRAAAGLPPDVPLLVYSGGVTRARGVETAIAALPRLPGVHLAVVCVPSIAARPVDELRGLAASLRSRTANGPRIQGCGTRCPGRPRPVISEPCTPTSSARRPARQAAPCTRDS
ncbi:hypothetical protein [Kribbella sp. NBC_00359]|uniref:hypothetical protein n=1 Tax=Kribbella sp. NBC_00359 TaxID=2975966 RepID=UPI002E1DC937